MQLQPGAVHTQFPPLGVFTCSRRQPHSGQLGRSPSPTTSRRFDRTFARATCTPTGYATATRGAGEVGELQRNSW